MVNFMQTSSTQKRFFFFHIFCVNVHTHMLTCKQKHIKHCCLFGPSSRSHWNLEERLALFVWLTAGGGRLEGIRWEYYTSFLASRGPMLLNKPDLG
jgi:hypothetical protein